MMVLVAQDKVGKASLAGFAESSGSIGTPDRVVDNDTRRMIHAGGSIAGSGGGNADALFVNDAAKLAWRRVDLSDWYDQGGKLLTVGRSEESRGGKERRRKGRT